MSVKENGNTEILWPPAEIAGKHETLVSSALAAVGTMCALEQTGHIKRNAKTFDGKELNDVAFAIVERGEFTPLETGFFCTLGDFIAWGRAPVSADFDAVLLKDRKIEDPVVAFEREFLDVDATVDRLEAAGAPDAEKKLAMLEWTKLQKQIATTPATTIRGVAAKLRSTLSETSDDYFDRELLESALESLERLAGGLPS